MDVVPGAVNLVGFQSQVLGHAEDVVLGRTHIGTPNIQVVIERVLDRNIESRAVIDKKYSTIR